MCSIHSILVFGHSVTNYMADSKTKEMQIHVPPDLLRIIFKYTLLTEYPFFPSSLFLVCKYWHKIYREVVLVSAQDQRECLKRASCILALKTPEFITRFIVNLEKGMTVDHDLRPNAFVFSFDPQQTDFVFRDRIGKLFEPEDANRIGINSYNFELPYVDGYWKRGGSIMFFENLFSLEAKDYLFYYEEDKELEGLFGKSDIMNFGTRVVIHRAILTRNEFVKRLSSKEFLLVLFGKYK